MSWHQFSDLKIEYTGYPITITFHPNQRFCYHVESPGRKTETFSDLSLAKAVGEDWAEEYDELRGYQAQNPRWVNNAAMKDITPQPQQLTAPEPKRGLLTWLLGG